MIELDVTGMTCGHCRAAVEKALMGVAGVRRAEVDLEAGKARVEGDPDPQSLVDAVKDEGYGAQVI
ncbi:MAG: heavy metal-associated domain-containing protein [Chromatiales bacterium]|jgi:copper chaperone CopZ